MPWLHRLMVDTCTARGSAGRRVDALTGDHLWREFAAHEPAELATALAALGGLDLAPRLGEIAVPAWVAAGAEDPLVPLAEARRIAAAIPGSSLTVYDNAGHLFFLDWPTLRDDFAAWRAGLARAGT